LNATATFITAIELGCKPERVIGGLEAYTGSHRRFEYRGESHGVRVFDDIAHHPTEVDAVLRAARSVAGDGKVIIAFQAHHFYRTEMFMDEFAQALGLADYTVVLEIFAPGETPVPGISGVVMASKVPLPPAQVTFEPSWSAVPQLLVNQAQPGDIIMTLGGSDIGMMCPQIIDLLNQKFDHVD
jgi:UDP-N-acetylmuramate--alanine ligase